MERRWKVLVVASAVVFMALLDVTVVNIAFTDLGRSFPRDSLADLSWVLNGYSVVFAAALVPAGRLADRYGRRRLFLAGLLLFLAASVASGLAASVPVLVAARDVQALGAASVLPTSLQAVRPPPFPALLPDGQERRPHVVPDRLVEQPETLTVGGRRFTLIPVAEGE
ncbi:MAG: MFS transporter, partial [Streptomyces sp.]|nr:MFS transporter [Streptomyces sp.]